MKAFLSAHWEKGLLGFALAAAAVIGVSHLVLAEPPVVIAEAEGVLQQIQGIGNQEKPFTEQVPKASAALAAVLGAASGVFRPERGLVGYDEDLIVEEVKLIVGERRTVAVDEECDTCEQEGEREAASAELSGEFGAQHVDIVALKPGRLLLHLKYKAKLKQTVTVVVRSKSRFELWPPQLKSVQPSPDDPGEVEITWDDDPRTTPNVTVGYVVERKPLRSAGPAGEPFVSVHPEGKMLPAWMRTYVDTVEPNRQYEYRVRAVGDATVTDVRN